MAQILKQGATKATALEGRGMDDRDEAALYSRIAELEALLIEEQQHRAAWASRALRAEKALAVLLRPKAKAPRKAAQIDIEWWLSARPGAPAPVAPPLDCRPGA